MADDVTCSWLRDTVELVAKANRAAPEDGQWLRKLHGDTSEMTRRLESLTSVVGAAPEDGQWLCKLRGDMSAMSRRLEEEYSKLYMDAADGRFERYKFLYEHGCPVHIAEACRSAAARGDLETLKYLHQHGCHWDGWTICAAAYHGRLECLSYALENDCPHTENEYHTAIIYANPACLSCLLAHMPQYYMNAEACRRAAARGDLETLKYLHEHGCPWDGWTIRAAAYHGRLECLTYALGNGCPHTETDYHAAMHNANPTCLALLSVYEPPQFPNPYFVGKTASMECERALRECLRRELAEAEVHGSCTSPTAAADGPEPRASVGDVTE